MTTDGKQALRIVRFEAENVKALKAVAIEPDGSLVEITGSNGAGKSSVLDAIWLALGGRAADCQEPIRKGEAKASVTLELGDYRVVRRWTRKTTTITVERDGATLKKPQAVLDGLVQRVGFDPLAFARLKPKERRERLLEMVNSPVDFDALADERAEFYDQRTAANRDVRRLTSRLEAMEPPAKDLPDEPDSATDLVGKLTAATDANRRISDLSHEIERERRLIAQLEEQILQKRGDIQAMDEELSGLSVQPVDELRGRLDDMQARNAAIAGAAEWRRIQGDLTAATELSERMSRNIEEVDLIKLKAVESAAEDLAIQGLGLSDEDLTVDGVPFSQACTSEQIEIGLALAMAGNPRLRVALIRDGSLLDARAMSRLKDWADANDAQVWIERVEEGGDGAWVIEEGELLRAGRVAW